MLMIQMNLFMVILLSIIAIHAYYRLNNKEHGNRHFLALVYLTILVLVLEILSVLLNNSNYFVAHKLINSIGFTLALLVPICSALYVYRRTKKYQKLNYTKLFWLSLPFVINSVIALGSYHYTWIFGITNGNSYLRGPLWFVSPLSSCFYYVILLLLLYNVRTERNREELLILSLLAIIPSLLSIFQIFYFIYLTIWNSVAIAVVINYIYIIHSQIKLDPLTGLGNRIAYNEYLSALHRKNKIVLAVLNVDLDDFKSINDVFGHHEGDKVLRLFARHLEAVFAGKGIAIRLGGDEFVVLINENKREVIEGYINALNKNINSYNESNNKPYRIKFSYGMTIFNSSYKSIDELMQHCDKLMYEAKKKRSTGLAKLEHSGTCVGRNR